MPVTYSDGETDVQLGDRVQVRFFLRRQAGEVHYVPGISKIVKEFEHNSLSWVGLSLPKGWATGVLVDPESQRVKASVRFMGRGELSAEAAAKLVTIVEKSEAEEPPEDPGESVGPPSVVDWVAAVTAMLVPAVLVTAVCLAIAWVIRFLVRLF